MRGCHAQHRYSSILRPGGELYIARARRLSARGRSPGLFAASHAAALVLVASWSRRGPTRCLHKSGATAFVCGRARRASAAGSIVEGSSFYFPEVPPLLLQLPARVVARGYRVGALARRSPTPRASRWL